MGKVIRLTENDLVRLVKKLIKEQGDENLGDKAPNVYGNSVFKALGPNFKISAHEDDILGDKKGGTYKSYFLQRFNYGSRFGGDGVNLNFDVIFLDEAQKKGKGLLSFVIIFSNGKPKNMGPCHFVKDGKSVSLFRKEIMEQVFPKIQGIPFPTNIS